MTLRQRILLLRVRPLAALLLGVSAPSVVACGSTASNGVAASPAKGTEGREGPTVQSSLNDLPSPAASEREPAVDPIDLVVKRDLWPLEPAAAERLLQGLGQVRRETVGPHGLSLVGGPTPTLARFDVSYSQDDDGHWTLNAASFFLRDADLTLLYARLETRIIERLGRPEWRSQQDELPSSGWSLGRDMSLLLAPSPNQGERLVMLSISEPEGEAE